MFNICSSSSVWYERLGLCSYPVQLHRHRNHGGSGGWSPPIFSSSMCVIIINTMTMIIATERAPLS